MVIRVAVLTSLFPDVESIEFHSYRAAQEISNAVNQFADKNGIKAGGGQVTKQDAVRIHAEYLARLVMAGELAIGEAEAVIARAIQSAKEE